MLNANSISRRFRPLAILLCLALVTYFGYTAIGARTLQTRNVRSVSGTVKVNGSEAPNVTVAFHRADESGITHTNDYKRCTVASTNLKGKFLLSTNGQAGGLERGNYNVTFYWPDPLVPTDECLDTDPMQHDRFRGLYVDPKLSGYQVQVDAQDCELKFDLWLPDGAR